MKIKGAGRINKAINVFRGNLNRQSFSKIVLPEYKHETVLPIQMVSFSGENTVDDQILSILSFLKNVGRPQKWSIFSDGTHSQVSKNKLLVFCFIEIFDNTFIPIEEDILKNLTWMEKKFYFFSSVSIEMTTIFLDSDILFFPGFNKNLLKAVRTRNWYLSELSAHFDPDYINDNMDNYPSMNFTNSGFFILNSKIDWETGKEYLKKLKNEKSALGHFSEQTAMEIVFKSNPMHFLDPRRFCISLEDHFTLHSKICHNDLAIRHFVGPIRYRMWLIAKKYKFFI